MHSEGRRFNPCHLHNLKESRVITYLSKTKLKQGFQCQKNLFFQVYHSNLARPYTSQEQSLFQQGHVVQAEAQKRFPNGIAIDVPFWDFSAANQKTKKALEENPPYIYEAFFQFKKFIARIDILELHEDGWNIIEVKSSLSVKEDHILDLTIQKHILQECGHPVNRCYLLHINKNCHYPNLDNLFLKVDVTDRIEEKRELVEKKISEFREMLNSKKNPQIKIGNHCFKPYPCRFQDQCWKGIPTPNVFSIPALGELAWDYYNKNQIHLKDVEEDELTPRQKHFKEVHLTKKPYINKQNIRDELSKWSETLYFLDFETVGSAIPRFDKSKPFQHIPFQYSALKVEGFKNKNKELLKIKNFESSCLNQLVENPDYIKQSETYSEYFNDRNLNVQEDHYLHLDSSDPRRPLAEQLVRFIGSEGNVVAYYKDFESLRLKEMAKLFPDLSQELLSISDRLVDPLPLLRESVCFEEFGSSWSIKSVAPVLLGSNWSYSSLEVSDGLLAQNTFEEMINLTDNPSKKDKMKNNLMLYCRQDTWCLVGLVKWLYNQI